MVADQQVKRLFKLVQTDKNFGIAAIMAVMDKKTARKYCQLGKLYERFSHNLFFLEIWSKFLRTLTNFAKSGPVEIFEIFFVVSFYGKSMQNKKVTNGMNFIDYNFTQYETSVHDAPQFWPKDDASWMQS